MLKSSGSENFQTTTGMQSEPKESIAVNYLGYDRANMQFLIISRMEKR